jgi:peptide chain release factor 2
MIILDDLKSELSGYKVQLSQLYGLLNIKKAQDELEQLRTASEQPDFWLDLEKSGQTMQRIKALENKINRFSSLETSLDDVITHIELALEEENSEEFVEEITTAASSFKRRMHEEKLSTLLTGEYDSKNAIVSFNSGAGGTEAQDWVEMLYRMYHMWAKKHEFSVKLLDYLDGDEAGIKSASILIEGVNAYGFLKSEAGVHRLVRISPFDSSGRRHTSFAAVEVMPEIDDSIEIDINPDDLKVDTYRSSGAGGQHVNKTESAIRITHIPSGIVCACQTQRSQHQNREYAMKMLRSRLIEIKEREHLDKISDIKGTQQQIAWGSQIRSYVFMPYTLVKDHRTDFEIGNVGAVMDGELDGFINAYLSLNSAKQA